MLLNFFLKDRFMTRFWPHAPPHAFEKNGSYIVTASTAGREHLFKYHEELDMVQSNLIELSEQYQCTLQAWARFPNHYHFVANTQSPPLLKKLIKHLHGVTDINLNKRHNVQGRKVWYEFGIHLSLMTTHITLV